MSQFHEIYDTIEYAIIKLMIKLHLYFPSELVETVQRESSELKIIFAGRNSPRPSYESQSSTESDFSSPVRAQHRHFKTNNKTMPCIALRYGTANYWQAQPKLQHKLD